MQQESANKIIYCVGNPQVLAKIGDERAYVPFDEETIRFLDVFSSRLRTDERTRAYPDVLTFAFWIRKASVCNMRKNYKDLAGRIGRGVAFHIAPSNIPTMFAFSLAASMLAGNPNIVRISSKEFEQSEAICKVLAELLEEEKTFQKRIVVVKYPRDNHITEELSGLCRSRIIWGGDTSVNMIRSIPLPPSAIELPFYDRFSFSIVGADGYLAIANKAALAQKFYNDTYLSDQNACSSPQLIVWIGKEKETMRLAQENFWSELEKIVKENYNFQPVQAVDKIHAACRYAIEQDNGTLEKNRMDLCRVGVTELCSDLKNYRCPGGYFYEYCTDSLEDIVTLCGKECQTISYCGLTREEIFRVVCENGCGGVDRIVPFGSTMDFGLRWDGFDFIDSLTRGIW